MGSAAQVTGALRAPSKQGGYQGVLRTISWLITNASKTLLVDLRWFLTHILNGGTPHDEFEVPVKGSSEQGTAIVHGILGINHPIEHLDMLTIISHDSPTRIPRLWQIAYDDGGRCFYLVRNGPMSGQVRFMLFIDWLDSNSLKTYFVAPDLPAFAKLLGFE